MRRNIKRTRKRHFVPAAFLLFLFFVMTGIFAWFVKCKIGPNLEEVGSIRAKVMVNQIVNKAINDELNETAGMDELLIRDTDSSGKTELIRANTQAINLFVTEVSKELREEFAARPEDTYTVPVGVLLGDRILSQAGPDVKLRVIPLSVTGIDFKTEFETQGINQTKYKVYLELVSDVKVLAPFTAEHVQVETTILVAEAVILGNVPDSYVYVPEEDILDVTQE